LAFPSAGVILELKTEEKPEVFWSQSTDWLAVLNYAGPESSSATIVHFPALEKTVIELRDFAPRSNGFRTLHDGSLAYIDDGKIFSWRSEYKEPVCIYDPERETILEKRSEF